ncbi:MAG TPA: hypothetical protein VH353_00910 [Caulobacteraceae bacterium]|jgi:hypothetical protein|nr:hypothetical protein [Caulobacteraceae bacterium]
MVTMMKAEIFTSVLALAAMSAPVTCSGGSVNQHNHTYYNGGIEGRGAPMPLSMMNLTPRKPLVRPYDRIGRTPESDRVPTAVSYKPFANGPVGSVGLVRLTASHALGAFALGNASDGQPGAPSQTVGANLLYAFH